MVHLLVPKQTVGNHFLRVDELPLTANSGHSPGTKKPALGGAESHEESPSKIILDT
jgi:hypothetical protein